MLIVVGGRSDTDTIVTDTVEIYDLSKPATNWIPATNFPVAIHGSRGVTLENIFFVTGNT